MLYHNSIYTEVTEEHVALFKRFWYKHIDALPELPSLLLSETDQKAAVFNMWIGFSSFIHYKLLKNEKTFSHSFSFQLVQALYDALPEQHIVLKQRHAYELHFVFAYYVVYEVLHVLEHPLQTSEHLKALRIPRNYYSLTDDDVTPDEDFYHLIKAYNVMLFHSDFEAEVKYNMLRRATAALLLHDGPLDFE